MAKVPWGRETMAGLAGAIGSVPDGMATAVLAGANPMAGLYASFAGPGGRWAAAVDHGHGDRHHLGRGRDHRIAVTTAIAVPSAGPTR